MKKKGWLEVRKEWNKGGKEGEEKGKTLKGKIHAYTSTEN